MSQFKVIEKNDERVLTTAQIASKYGTDTKTVSYNFNYNKHRFTEGKHFFVLSGDDRKEFLLNHREIHDSSKHAKYIYLWTVKGALLHAKSLGTDEAWTAYEQLVDDYFTKSDQLQRLNVPTQTPQTMEDLMIMAAINMKELRSQIIEVKEENKQLKLVVDNEIVLTRSQRGSLKDAVMKRQGELTREGYTQKHFQAIWRTVNQHFGVAEYADINRVDYEQAMKIIQGWYPKKKEEEK